MYIKVTGLWAFLVSAIDTANFTIELFVTSKA